MISWDDSQTILQNFCQDSSAAGVLFQNMMSNIGYKEVLAALGRQVTEVQATSLLVVAQRNYQVPPDCLMPKTLVLVSGTTRYNVTEEPSDKKWELRRYSQQTGLPTKFHYRPRFGIGGGIIELDPIPGTAYTLELTYEATERDLSKAKYTAGTVTLNSGSAVVNGSATTFVADMVGRYLRSLGDGSQRLPYRIKQFSSVTSLVLENVYQGGTQAGLNYEIIEIFALPEDIHMLPLYYAAWQWWSSKGNVTRAAQFETQYSSGLEQGKKRHSLVVRDQTIEFGMGGGGMLGDGIGDSLPWWFPQSVAS